ncbi:MAG: hypothetical protein HUJ58_07600 [Erysipelotrichaceae bacterium]|nr:hypothetical protein [Erysipelotrichaceae bacterium]
MAKKRKEERLGINWLFWFALIIVAIPCGLFAYILYTASQNTGTPIVGDRFLGDLDPAITEEALTELRSDIRSIEGVEEISVNCIVATLRVNVDVDDTKTREEVSKITEAIYTAIDAKLPVDVYFTATDAKKMYDMELNVYNNLNLESPDFIMYNLVKNSPMKTYILSDVSTPINAELAQELRDYVIERDKEYTEEDIVADDTGEPLEYEPDDQADAE